ncbi:hypothetical protein HU200_036540 [Digitaria exilis]|uniref:Uncharacterized protein n=1 Tax=Digitaria exilis TaxID=1010633 RepID=A0A835EKB9_9POAL|nr:hypothetical protein HU200_036540 [Digitaria exilis]
MKRSGSELEHGESSYCSGFGRDGRSLVDFGPLVALLVMLTASSGSSSSPWLLLLEPAVVGVAFLLAAPSATTSPSRPLLSLPGLASMASTAAKGAARPDLHYHLASASSPLRRRRLRVEVAAGTVPFTAPSTDSLRRMPGRIAPAPAAAEEVGQDDDDDEWLEDPVGHPLYDSGYEQWRWQPTVCGGRTR